MAVAKQQLAIVGLKTQEEADAEAALEAADRERRGIMRHRLMAAIRDFARLRQQNVCATELDKDDSVFGGGKGVSASAFRACLEGTERNYFRLDWLFWFVDESDEVADLIVEIGKRGLSQKTPEEELQDLRDLVRQEMPKQADKLIRKAAAPKR